MNHTLLRNQVRAFVHKSHQRTKARTPLIEHVVGILPLTEADDAGGPIYLGVHRFVAH